MTKTECNKQRKRIRKYLDKWVPWLYTNSSKLNIEYVDAKDEDGSIAKTWAKWEYRDAIIEFYLPECQKCNDKDLENTVVHEIIHVILAPIAPSLKSQKGKLLELVCCNLASSVLDTYEEGKKHGIASKSTR